MATAGGDETLTRIFLVNVEGHDADGPPDRVHHLVVQAFRQEDAPPLPCYDGVPAGSLAPDRPDVLVLVCPPSSPEAEAEIRHGEGIHIEHILGYWDDRGVLYAVSVHGTDEASRSLLEAVVRSVELVEP